MACRLQSKVFATKNQAAVADPSLRAGKEAEDRLSLEEGEVPFYGFELMSTKDFTVCEIII